MQIKTVWRVHFTPTRTIKIKKTKDNKHWWGCEEKDSYSLLVGMLSFAAAMEISIEFPQKTEARTVL